MLGAALDVVVVVVQCNGGVRFPRKLESLREEVWPNNLKPLGGAKILGVSRAGRIADGFIDDVPAGDLAFEMPDERMDVILEPRQRQIPIGSLKEPGVRLRVPNQACAP